MTRTAAVIALAALCALVLAFLTLRSGAQAVPRIIIDCGTLTGAGSVDVVIESTTYLSRFKCGQEA